VDENLLDQGRPGNTPAELRFMVLAVLAGSLAGLLGSLFHLGIDRLVTWPTLLGGYLGGWKLAAASAGIVMACTVASVAIVRRYAPEAGGSGVQEIEGAMEGLREVRWRRVLPVKFFAGLMAIGSGLVLGREGPTIHIGASISAAVAEKFRVNELERRGLLSAGAAAGLACAFNAPLAAVLFIIEETHKEFPYTFRTYLGVIFAAIASTVVTQMFGGVEPNLPIAAEMPALTMLPLFLLLGVVLGPIGVLLNTSILRALDFAGWAQARAPYLYPATIGLVIGLLFVLVPQSVTGGESVILHFASDRPAVAVLLGLAVLRFATTVGSYSTGVPGGIFAPILAIAACVGLVFGELSAVLLPGAGVVPNAFLIVALGGLFTASVRAPIVGVALTLELTGSYALCLPLLVTCVVSDLVAQWVGGRPIYTQLLERTLGAAGARSTGAERQPTGLA
jgi:CIC family chloride channel protein